MNSVLSILAAPLIAVQLIILTPIEDKPCENADLVVVQIVQPDYDSMIDGTTFDVIIQNQGKAPSEKTTLKAFDLDISYEEAKKSIKEKETLELIAENNGRAEYYQENENLEVDKDKFDYDQYWEKTETVPALKPKETITITVSIKDHWIYDSNCEIRAIVDPENKTEDCNRENNQLDFFGWG